MADSVEFLLGKISGQLDGLEQRFDELKDAVAGAGSRQRQLEDRVGILERLNSRQSGIIASIATLASLLGGGVVAYLGKKFGS